MNSLKKLAATSFVVLTVLIQPAFAANKFTKIAGFAAGSAQQHHAPLHHLHYMMRYK